MGVKNINNDELIANIIKGIEAVKGENIKLMDLTKIDNTPCDYFIICDGNSSTQVNAIAGSVQRVVSKELHDKPWHVEGEVSAEWVLLDYVNVVVHVFQKPIRAFYKIDNLWGDAKITNIDSQY